MNAELIVALDVPSMTEMTAAAAVLPDTVKHCKVGLELFTAAGPACVAHLVDRNISVFLDLKLHDIPRTVARAVSSAARLGASLLTVHASGGREMLRAAAQAAADAAPRSPRVVAVTVLTSLSQEDMADIGVTRALPDHALALGRMAIEAGLDGLVCAAHEAAALRREFGPSPLLVVPGIRPAGGEAGDQKRIATPRAAVLAGATHLVVGRPILEAPDPRAAAHLVLREIAEAASVGT